MTAVPAPALEGRGLVCGYDGEEILRGVSIVLAAGELVVLLGPSGSGKTSLLNVLSGFTRPARGDVALDGAAVDPAGLSWSTLSLVPQALGLLGELTTTENVVLPARLAGTAPDEDAVEALLGRLDLGRLGARLPGQLSLGECQRVAVARAVSLRSRIVLADEPTSHQDERRARQVLAVLQDHSRTGGACLVASHDPAVVAAASRVLVLEEGRVRSPQSGR